MARRLSRIAVVGSGLDAWLSALGLARAVSALGVDIEVVELPGDTTPIALDLLPAVKALHGLLGITEREILGLCGAVPIVGQRYSDWGLDDPPFLHTYAQVGETLSHMDFLQHWLRARSRGMPAKFSDFSRAGVAVAKRRAPPLQAHWPGADYGYHIDGVAYCALLRRKALGMGVQVRAVRQALAVWEAGRITRLDLAEHGESQADLYIDATGHDARLIGGAAAAEWEGWSQWLPFGRISAFTAPPSKSLEAVTDVRAWEAGWVCTINLQKRRVLNCAFDEKAVEIDAVADRLMKLAGGTLNRVSDHVLSPGMRRSWVGNCVALGQSGIRADLLDGGWLHGLQVGLTHLVALFPVDQAMASEARAFNAAVRRHAEALRDFQAAHYQLARRPDPAWRAAAAADPPVSLDWRLRLFGVRGALGAFEDETFQADNWRMMLLGHGLTPNDPDPGAAGLDDTSELQRMQGMMQALVNEVSRLPTVEDWISAKLAA